MTTMLQTVELEILGLIFGEIEFFTLLFIHCRPTTGPKIEFHSGGHMENI